MQISSEQVSRVLRESTRRPGEHKTEAPIGSVEDLAAKHGVSMDDVRRFTESAMAAEEDPTRERRVRELSRRIAAGTYNVEAEQIVDMAERRAIADRSNEI